MFTYRVVGPYSWLSRTVWYVVDNNGDPVDSYSSKLEAQGAAATMNYGEPCGACNEIKPCGQSCACFDNGCQ